MKVIDATFVTSMSAIVCLVVTEDEITHEKKIRVGVIPEHMEEEASIKFTAKTGGYLPPSDINRLISLAKD